MLKSYLNQISFSKKTGDHVTSASGPSPFSVKLNLKLTCYLMLLL